MGDAEEIIVNLLQNAITNEDSPEFYDELATDAILQSWSTAASFYQILQSISSRNHVTPIALGTIELCD